MVVDEASSTALNDATNGGQEINLSAASTKPASIRHWLAAGCQVIRWDAGDEMREADRGAGVMAMYRQNAAQVLFPVGTTHRPAGPAAFLGEIIVNASCFPPGEVSAKATSFQFFIAHELTHVFDMLRLLIPAMKNWPKFWRNVLGAGQRCESARRFKVLQGTFVDDYGSENELAIVKEYWPSRAEEWFAALQ